MIAIRVLLYPVVIWQYAGTKASLMIEHSPISTHNPVDFFLLLVYYYITSIDGTAERIRFNEI